MLQIWGALPIEFSSIQHIFTSGDDAWVLSKSKNVCMNRFEMQ